MAYVRSRLAEARYEDGRPTPTDRALDTEGGFGSGGHLG